MKLWDPYKDQWWNAPKEQMFQAYYMTLRVHYGMSAVEAFATAKKNAAVLGIDRGIGLIGVLREGHQPTRRIATEFMRIVDRKGVGNAE